MASTEPRILSGGRHGDPNLPLITVDLDGVLSEPPLGLNLTSRGAELAPDDVPALGRFKRLAWQTEPIRYYGRRQMSGAAAFLQQLSPHFRLYLVTARGLPAARHTRGWLEHNGLWRYLDGLIFRAGPERRPYQFKAETVAALQPFWHVDDDGRTAMHVASRSGRPVLLIAWPGNAGVYPNLIVRVRGLAAGATYLLRQKEDASSSSSSGSVSPPIEAAKTS
ncbi:MAG: hypothetical protein AB7R89_11480 [Dehalococcoidia bacterium]